MNINADNQKEKEKQTFNFEEISPLINKDAFFKSIIFRQFSGSMRRFRIPFTELTHEANVAHYLSLIKLTEDRLGIKDNDEIITNYRDAVKKINDIVNDDPNAANYLKDNFSKSSAIGYIWVSINGHLRNYIKNTYTKYSGHIPFSSMDTDNDKNGNSQYYYEKIVDPKADTERSAVEQINFQQLLQSIRDAITKNAQNTKQANRDWTLLLLWLDGKAYDQIAKELPWLKNEDSVKKSLYRIIDMIRVEKAIDRTKPVDLNRNYSNLDIRKKSGKSRKEMWRDWWNNLTDEKRAAIQERNRKKIAEKRLKKKNDAILAESDLNQSYETVEI